MIVMLFQRTSEEVVSAYIDRVKEVNPYLNAVVEERYRAALDEARSVDRQIQDARSKVSKIPKTIIIMQHWTSAQ